MSMGTRFHDTQASGLLDPSSTAGPSYDFVAKPRAGVVGNPNFAAAPAPALGAALADEFVPDKAPGLSAVQKGGVAIGLSVVLVLVISIVVSFAWPAVQDYRRQAQVRSTQVEFPKQVAAMAKRGGTGADRVAGLVGQFNFPASPQGAEYAGAKGRVAVVAAGAMALSDHDQQDFLAAASDSAHSHGVVLTDIDPGQRGGTMRCGQAKGQTTCVFADVAAFGVLSVPSTGADGQNLARVFRAAVETRH